MKKLIGRIKTIEKAIDVESLAKEGARYLRSITPIKTGNARRNTTAEGNEILANYNYAGKLDEGASSQNRTGMIEPTLEHLRNEIIKRAK